ALLNSAFEGTRFALGMRLNDLGRFYQHLGRYLDARTCCDGGLELTIQFEDDDDSSTAACHSNLEDLLRDMGDIDWAIPHLVLAVAISECKLEHNDPDLATSLSNLAMALRARGRFQRAWVLLKRALDIDLEFYGPKKSAGGHDYNNLGQVLKDVAVVGRG